MIRVNATYNQRSLVIIECFKALLNPPVIHVCQLLIHELSQVLLHLPEYRRLRQIFHELFVDAGVRNPDPHIVSVEINSKTATFEELQFKVAHPLASLDKVTRIGEQMECHQITMEQTFHDLQAELVDTEMRGTWKR